MYGLNNAEQFYVNLKCLNFVYEDIDDMHKLCIYINLSRVKDKFYAS